MLFASLSGIFGSRLRFCFGILSFNALNAKGGSNPF